MPQLKPLQEWYCDCCGEIVNPMDGWLQWLSDRQNGIEAHDFKITHKFRECQIHRNSPYLKDLPLERVLGPDGLLKLLSMLDVGPVLNRRKERNTNPPDLISFTETVRRLHIPFYEQARLYFDNAESDGFFDSANETSVHLPSTNQNIVERYSTEQN